MQHFSWVQNIIFGFGLDTVIKLLYARRACCITRLARETPIQKDKKILWQVVSLFTSYFKVMLVKIVTLKRFVSYVIQRKIIKKYYQEVWYYYYILYTIHIPDLFNNDGIPISKSLSFLILKWYWIWFWMEVISFLFFNLFMLYFFVLIPLFHDSVYFLL